MHQETGDKSPHQRNRYSCFRCASGCIHIVADNVMITLSQEQFLGFAQAIDNVLQTIEPESKVFTGRTYAKPVIM
jgi:hypothetical protein